jgi:hypothetical protein
MCEAGKPSGFGSRTVNRDKFGKRRGNRILRTRRIREAPARLVQNNIDQLAKFASPIPAIKTSDNQSSGIRDLFTGGGSVLS